MAKQLVRIKSRPHDIAELYHYEIMIEAVTEDGFLCALHWFGEAAQQGARYPFKLEQAGRIDFGSGYADKDRYWSTTLNRHAIRAGETFSITGTDENQRAREVLYNIRDVAIVFRDV